MAEINKELIEYLSGLSAIGLTEKEKEDRNKDLQQILDYIDQLNEIDTSDIKPCTYVAQSLTQTPLRDDVPLNTLPQKKFLDNAPQHTAQMIRVPQVLKKET
jgi:aspartyl-tRNA(Asn)/glutamyl-tRNA(Gln) amidotransferase subunit C